MMKNLWRCGTIGVLIICCVLSCTSKKQLKKEKEADALRKLGEAYMLENRDAAAFQKLMEAKDLNPEDPYIYFALGNFYFNKKKYDLAIENYSKCLELKPEFASVRNNLGLVYLEIGEYDTAISYFSELSDNYIYATPHYPRFNMGQAYFYKNNYKEAKRCFREALEMDPQFTIALHWLGRTYIELGNIPEATASLEKAVQMTPEVVEIHFDLGRAYTLSKAYNNAMYEYRRVMELDPGSLLADEAKQHIDMIKKMR